MSVPNDSCDLLCLDLPVAEKLRMQHPELAELRSLANTFGVLADPTRLEIALTLLAAEELCVCDLSWIVERAQNLVSHHLRGLRELGLVEYRRDGKMALYSLTPRGIELLETVGALSGVGDV